MRLNSSTTGNRSGAAAAISWHSGYEADAMRSALTPRVDDSARDPADLWWSVQAPREQRCSPALLLSLGELTLSEDAGTTSASPGLRGECIALRMAPKAAVGTLVKVSRGSALVDVIETSDISRPAPIHLLAPVADKERMLWLAEKVTELGITSWRPLLWRRSKSVSPRGEGSMFQGKVRARMTSALIQSGGGWLPDIFPEATIERAVAAAPLGTRLLLAKDGEPLACR